MCWVDKYNVTTGWYQCCVPEVNVISLETIRYKIFYPIKPSHQNPQNIQKCTYKYYKTMYKFKFLKEVPIKLGGKRECGGLFAKMVLHVLLCIVIWLLLSSTVEITSSQLFSGLVLCLVLINSMWKKWGFISSKPRLQEGFQLSVCSLGT